MTRSFRKSPVRLLADARRLNLRNKATGAAWARLTQALKCAGYELGHDEERSLADLCDEFGIDCPPEWTGWSLRVRKQ